MKIDIVKTKAYLDQKPGTSGIRKKVKVFQQENYVENFIQASFEAVGLNELKDKTLVVGGDGRYYNDKMIQIIIKMAKANGVGKLLIGQNGLLSTPAVSDLIRVTKSKGGFILTASHNPGGPTEDAGIKYNTENGGPAPEKVTGAIFKFSKEISEYKICKEIPDVDLKVIKSYDFDGFKVDVIDATASYIKLMKEVFDFKLLKSFVERKDFRFVYDAMHGVGGPYATAIFAKELGIAEENLLNCVPKEDFGGGHPDPNLTYAHDLVEIMGLNKDGTIKQGGDAKKIPDMGAAADGDADRNMVLGKQFFVTPSDSLAVIAAFADECIPYFKNNGGLKGLARSMPTSAAADLVAKKKKTPFFQVPTGWKFFGNLMDSGVLGKTEYSPLICGEESFGTGSSHVREKDGIWAVLAWLSILAFHNTDATKPLVSIEQIIKSHWQEYGRNYYSRYDYEGVETEKAAAMMKQLSQIIVDFNKDKTNVPKSFGDSKYTLESCEEFEYNDSVDGSVSSNQGWIFLLSGGSRFVFRLSGTGSSGATIRLYLEQYDDKVIDTATAEALKDIVSLALATSQLEEFTGRKEPTVIT